MTGARCGNVTSTSSTKQVSYVPVSHVWIAGVIAPLVVVVAVASVLVIYLLRKNGYDGSFYCSQYCQVTVRLFISEGRIKFKNTTQHVPRIKSRAFSSVEPYTFLTPGMASGRSLDGDCMETLSWSSCRSLDRPTPQRHWICSCHLWRQAILRGHGGATRRPELATR